MKRLRRLWCRLFGHGEEIRLTVGVNWLDACLRCGAKLDEGEHEKCTSSFGGFSCHLAQDHKSMHCDPSGSLWELDEIQAFEEAP